MIMTFDSRGNGDGCTCCTITGDHESRITDYTSVVIDENGGGETMEEKTYAVRRLTPLECERLQGFPDGWTNIGEWVDSKGKVHKESSDSNRYKALGNSIATGNNSFWKYVLKRISAQYDREATMASLFSGIGGFDLLWVQLNGRDSVLWESEIEEFPMAVTKMHFGDEETGVAGDYARYL